MSTEELARLIIALVSFPWALGFLVSCVEFRMHPGWAATWPLWGALWLLVAIPRAVAWFLVKGLPNGARAFARDFPRLLP